MVVGRDLLRVLTSDLIFHSARGVGAAPESGAAVTAAAAAGRPVVLCWSVWLRVTVWLKVASTRSNLSNISGWLTEGARDGDEMDPVSVLGAARQI